VDPPHDPRTPRLLTESSLAQADFQVALLAGAPDLPVRLHVAVLALVVHHLPEGGSLPVALGVVAIGALLRIGIVWIGEDAGAGKSPGPS
jgi:hypothetical protein